MNGKIAVLDRLYAVTDRQLARLENREIVARLLVGGARLIQLRDKQANARHLLDDARIALKLTRAAGARLIVNDRVDVALAADADGVHLGQDDLAVEEARAILGPEKIIGLSTHTLEQFREGLLTSADYLAVGPVYTTKTKDDASPVVGLEMVRRAHELADRPLVAIGGITRQRAREVIDAGADTIAVISALYPPPLCPEADESDDEDAIITRTREMLAAVAD
ncbi:MAG: thiamine phosphate synthase [Blastocatellales bacterium]|nr:thiamine phosphate synthase [Blastocatellales bacterium]